MHLANITFDCEDPPALATFWAEVLGRTVGPGANPFFAMIEDSSGPGPRLLFLRVPEAKSAKNRVHFDLHVDAGVDDHAGEVERILTLGATRVHDKDEWGVAWTTLRDPEGNEFCVGRPHDER